MIVLGLPRGTANPAGQVNPLGDDGMSLLQENQLRLARDVTGEFVQPRAGGGVAGGAPVASRRQ